MKYQDNYNALKELPLFMEMKAKIKMLKNHGQIKNYEHEIVGGNSRLDSLNAFVLNEKLNIFSYFTQYGLILFL